MNTLETINYSTTNRVATIELNRPKTINAFSQQLRFDLLAAVQLAEQDNDVRVVIITGAGKGFSSGADLNGAVASCATVEEQLITEDKPYMMAIHQSDKIYISAVNGVAAGIGGALALTCDMMIMGESAYIYQAFSVIGLIPDGGASWHLVNSLGYKRAFQLIVEAGKLTADECVQYGLANKIAPDDMLRKNAQKWAERLAQGAPIAQKHIKNVLNQAQDQSLSESFDLEAKSQNEAFLSNDCKEGVTAFFEKRQANFTGE